MAISCLSCLMIIGDIIIHRQVVSSTGIKIFIHCSSFNLFDFHLGLWSTSFQISYTCIIGKLLLSLGWLTDTRGWNIVIVDFINKGYRLDIGIQLIWLFLHIFMPRYNLSSKWSLFWNSNFLLDLNFFLTFHLLLF